MSGSSRGASSDDKIKEAAWKLCLRIDGRINRLCPESKIWSAAELDAAKRSTLTHHAEHVERLRIRQKHMDPNKFLSWYAFFLLEQVRANAEFGRARADLLSIVTCEMNALLEHSFHTIIGCCNLGLKRECLRDLRRLASLDREEDEFAIGKNGLYAAFKAATEVKSRLAGLITNGTIVLETRQAAC